LQQADEVLGMRSLARTAHRDIANGYDWYIECPALQDSEVEQLVAQPNGCAIEPTERREPFVNFDEVALCSHALVNV
jgi:hypothetical protein